MKTDGVGDTPSGNSRDRQERFQEYGRAAELDKFLTHDSHDLSTRFFRSESLRDKFIESSRLFSGSCKATEYDAGESKTP